MSTKSSIAFFERTHTVIEEIHVYHETLDNSYYIDINDRERIKISKDVAEAFGEALEKLLGVIK